MKHGLTPSFKLCMKYVFISFFFANESSHITDLGDCGVKAVAGYPCSIRQSWQAIIWTLDCLLRLLCCLHQRSSTDPRYKRFHLNMGSLQMAITQIARLQVCIPQSAFLGIGAVISDTYRKQRLLIIFLDCVAKEAQLPGEELEMRFHQRDTACLHSQMRACRCVLNSLCMSNKFPGIGN